MHGTRVFLPNKIRFFINVCQELQTDVIAFAYRSFSLSDKAQPNEAGFLVDVDAITKYFTKAVEEKGGVDQVEAVLWGKSFGCATSLYAAQRIAP